MAQLDRLLTVMISNREEALALDEGEHAKLELSGGARAVTKSPLTAGQIVGLLKEIAPVDAGRQIDAAKPVTFSYTTTDGIFAVRAIVEGGKWVVRIALEAGAPAQSSQPFDPLSGFQAAATFMTPSEVPRVAPAPTPAAPTPTVRDGVPPTRTPDASPFRARPTPGAAQPSPAANAAPAAVAP